MDAISSSFRYHVQPRNRKDSRSRRRLLEVPMSDRQGGGWVVPTAGEAKRRFCALCDCPVAVFGRLSPCWHLFCLICAADMETCALYVTLFSCASHSINGSGVILRSIASNV